MKLPFVTLEKIREIEKEFPTPFHLYQEKGIRENARNLYKAFSWNKNFKEYFAVKATPTPGILQILKEEGCGVDCSSYTELLLSEAMGFSGEEIIFSSNVTPDQDYLLANKLHAIINLDDLSDIQKLGGLIKLPKTICLRYNPGGSFTIGNFIMDNPAEAKFGMTQEQLIQAVKVLIDRGVENFGLHAFLASNTLTDAYYPTLAGILFRAAVEIKQKTGANVTFVNLSGGIGIPYRPEDKPNDIFEIGASVKNVFEEILVPNGMGDVALYAELGRFMTGPYGCLIATVMHEKKIYKDYIGLDACATNLMRPAMYGAYHHITVLGKENQPCDHIYDVTGGLCENNDKFAKNRALPQIEIGDTLCIHDTGAHGFSMGYNYNGKLRSSEILLKEDGSFSMLRRAETPADYFSTFDFLKLF